MVGRRFDQNWFKPDLAMKLEETMKTTLAALLLGLMTIAVTGCNTTRGFGQDVEATGEAIEEAAENTKEKISN